MCERLSNNNNTTTTTILSLSLLFQNIVLSTGVNNVSSCLCCLCDSRVSVSCILCVFIVSLCPAPSVFLLCLCVVYESLSGLCDVSVSRLRLTSSLRTLGVDQSCHMFVIRLACWTHLIIITLSKAWNQRSSFESHSLSERSQQFPIFLVSQSRFPWKLWVHSQGNSGFSVSECRFSMSQLPG